MPKTFSNLLNDILNLCVFYRVTAECTPTQKYKKVYINKPFCDIIILYIGERRINMTVKKQELYNVIEKLPEELSAKVLDYIEYLKFSSLTNDAPKDLVVKDKTDLRKKLEEGIKDFKNGNVCSLEQAYSEVKEILVD